MQDGNSFFLQIRLNFIVDRTSGTDKKPQYLSRWKGMRLSNGFVIDKEKTFGELKFTAVYDVFLQNEDGTPSTQLKKRIYDLKCSLHGGIIPVSVPPEVPLREFPYNAVVELVNPVADTVSRKTYTGADVDWYVKAEDIVLKNKGNQNAGNPQNNNTQGQPKK